MILDSNEQLNCSKMNIFLFLKTLCSRTKKGLKKILRPSFFYFKSFYRSMSSGPTSKLFCFDFPRTNGIMPSKIPATTPKKNIYIIT